MAAVDVADDATPLEPMEKLSDSKSYYDILGVSKSATDQEVSKGARPNVRGCVMALFLQC